MAAISAAYPQKGIFTQKSGTSWLDQSRTGACFIKVYLSMVREPHHDKNLKSKFTNQKSYKGPRMARNFNLTDWGGPHPLV